MMTTQAMKENRAAAEITLVVRRVIKASRQRVFEAWTKPEMIQEWFGPAEMTVSKVTNDLRVNGAYRIEMEGRSENCAATAEPDKKPVAYGTYKEIVPNERLSFTWRGDWGDIGDTLVTLEFKDAPGGTEIVLTHTGFASQEMKEGHSKGWNGSFEKLDRYIQQ
jgi:uncharacterized protein YndB with AHSA1/START domain